MFRITRLSGKFMAIEIESLEDDIVNAEDFINEGTPVIYVNEIGHFDDLDITVLTKPTVEIVAN